MNLIEQNKIYLGNAIDVLRTFSDESMHCCVTSPPYFALRSYLPDDDLRKHLEIGMSESPAIYIERLVEVFREVKRVLRNDGTLWIVIADSYAGNKIDGLKAKDLIGVPWSLAFALRKDGWWLRQDILWQKPNALPSSVKDRCTTCHEYIFLLAKNKKYYFDADAIKEPAKYAGDNRGARTDNRRGTMCNSMSGITGEFRNKRSVWTINTKPLREAHFASFPPDLIRPCILAGCPEGEQSLTRSLEAEPPDWLPLNIIETTSELT